MKKALIFSVLILCAVAATCQTGPGWTKQQGKRNFLDSTNFVKLPLLAGSDTLATRAYSRLYGGTSTGAGVWGAISGTLTDQTDLVNAFNAKANLASPAFSGTVSGITAAMVGLGNVTNESKATMFASPTFTGSVSGVTANMVGLGNVTNESKATMFTSPLFTGSYARIGTDTLSTRAYSRSVGGGSGSMVYPGDGIAVASGGAWTTPITNNSANWNTAYTWGNHASAGYAAVGQTMYIGTTAVTINRASNALTLAGITLTTPNIGTPSAGNLVNCTFPTLNQNTTGSAATLTTPRTIGGVSFNGSANITVSSATGGFTVTGGNLSVGTNSITMSGSLGATGTRLTKGWFTDLEVTNLPTVNGGTLKSALSLTPSDVGLGDVNDVLDSIRLVLADSVNIEELLQIDFATDTIPSMDWVRTYVADNGGGVSGDSVSLGDVAPLLADDEPIFVFGIGSGQTADTVAFNNGAIAGAFYYNGEHTLKITSLVGVLAEGSGTETISVQVSWHATFKSGSATNLNSSALAITSITTGTTDTTFANDEIPPGVWVWCTLSGTSAGDRPSLLILTMSGHKLAN